MATSVDSLWRRTGRRRSLTLVSVTTSSRTTTRGRDGFCVTSEVADVVYRCSSYYDETLERGFNYDDPDVAIPWPDIDLIPSQRDATPPASPRSRRTCR